ncbi:MAG: response regulator, partial [Pirellulales bacterium]|nr:response regulator [Pirellulales bacterium]
PDVVILDLRMPGMDGYEVCRMIKAQDSTRHAEVIAITAFPSPESEQRIIDCGARVCLAKPLDLDLLVKEIEKSL